MAIAVEYETARGIDDILPESIGVGGFFLVGGRQIEVGVFLIVVAQQLQGEKAYEVDKDDANSYTANHKLSVAEIVGFQWCLILLYCSLGLFSYQLQSDAEQRSQHC